MIKLKTLLPECNECGRDWNHGHDHESGMAKNELRDMISNASKIDSMVGEGDNLPGWVSAYISLAADYMHSVAEYLAGETSRMQQPGPGYAMYEAKKKKPSAEFEIPVDVKIAYKLWKDPNFSPGKLYRFNSGTKNPKDILNRFASELQNAGLIKVSAAGHPYVDALRWLDDNNELHEAKKKKLPKKQKINKV